MHLDVEASLSLLAVREPLVHLLDCPFCRSHLRALLAEELPAAELVVSSHGFFSPA